MNYGTVVNTFSTEVHCYMHCRVVKSSSYSKSSSIGLPSIRVRTSIRVPSKKSYSTIRVPSTIRNLG